MNKVLLFVLLLIGCLVLPLLVAGALSSVGGVGPLEMGIIFTVCLVAAVAIWRSQMRRAP